MDRIISPRHQSPKVLNAPFIPPEPSAKAPKALAGWRRWPITKWTKANVVDPCVAIFTSGLEPRLVAYSLAWGLTVGVFPICGVTSLVCILVSFILGSSCHAPTMVFATFLATPIELMLIIPYVRMGEALMSLPPMDITPSSIFDALQGKAGAGLPIRLLGSVIAWLITTPFICWVLYKIFLPISVRMGKPKGGSGSLLPQGGPSLVRKSVKDA